MKRFGVITTGGDCPGLNSVIYSIHKSLQQHNVELVGIFQYGLDNPEPYKAVALKTLDPCIMSRAGTILGSMVDQDVAPFDPDRVKNMESNFFKAIEGFDIEGLFLLGGDNSIRVARRVLRDLPLLVIPKTIDNDVIYTQQAVGFRSAIETVTNLIDNLRQTGSSHKRVMIAEVMGRDTGFLALEAGLASFADVILIPERPLDYAALKDFIVKRYNESHYGVLIVVAEGAPDIKEFIEKEVPLPSRYTRLGHLQRGGNVAASDRFMAANLGVHAVDLALQGIWNKVVVWDGCQAVHKDFVENGTKQYVTDAKLELCQKLNVFI